MVERNVPPKPLCVFLGFVFVFSPPDDEKTAKSQEILSSVGVLWSLRPASFH